jgi:uncharacterized membrane protein YfcA
VEVSAVSNGRLDRTKVGRVAGVLVVCLSSLMTLPAGAAPAQMATPTPTGTPPGSQIPAPPMEVSKTDDEGPPRLSLPTEADRDAWKRSGFRLALGLGYGRLVGINGAPSGRLLGAIVRLGLRLDADWSVLASFQYASASAANGLSGLRFAGTIDPTWHATAHLSLAVGLGFGGIVEGRTSRSDIAPLPSTIDSSYTFPSSNPPLPSCSGVGVAGLARAEWTIVLGPRAATRFVLEGIGQWTGCVDDTGTVEPDTGKAIVRRQWWPHVGGTGSWEIMWR